MKITTRACAVIAALAYWTLALLLTVGCAADFGGSLEMDSELAARGGNGRGGGGNGAPSGAHFNLNLIGVPKDKSADMTGNSGHRIFVKLFGNSKIMLAEGEDFQVLDANGTDGRAEFMLPNPDPENDGVTEYSVFARALGKPGGSSATTTCAVDADGTEWCSAYSMVLVRDKGGSSFRNVSRELLYMYADLDGDGHLERLPLFDDGMEEYYWNHDNNGLRLAQLRFYEIPTTVD